MQRYRGASHGSGVATYESGRDFIRVKFSDGGVYLYTYTSTGSGHIEQMKALAAAGAGLNTYINVHVRERYARQEK